MATAQAMPNRLRPTSLKDEGVAEQARLVGACREEVDQPLCGRHRWARWHVWAVRPAAPSHRAAGKRSARGAIGFGGADERGRSPSRCCQQRASAARSQHSMGGHVMSHASRRRRRLRSQPLRRQRARASLTLTMKLALDSPGWTRPEIITPFLAGPVTCALPLGLLINQHPKQRYQYP